MAERIAQFRSAHEPVRAKMVPPHLTLIFGLANALAPELISRCKDLAKQVSEFVVEFETIERIYDPFDNTYKMFLVCGTGHSTLIGMHERLYDGQHRTELNPAFPYRPHMTVATNTDRAAIDLIDAAAIGTLPISGQIRALEVVNFADGILRAIATIPL